MNAKKQEIQNKELAALVETYGISLVLRWCIASERAYLLRKEAHLRKKSQQNQLKKAHKSKFATLTNQQLKQLAQQILSQPRNLLEIKKSS